MRSKTDIRSTKSIAFFCFMFEIHARASMGWRAVEEVLDQISTQLTPNGCPLLVLFFKMPKPNRV